MRFLKQRKWSKNLFRFSAPMVVAGSVLFSFQNCEMTSQCQATVGTSTTSTAQCATKANSTTAGTTSSASSTPSSTGTSIPAGSSSTSTVLGGGTGSTTSSSGGSAVLGGGSSTTTTGGGSSTVLGGGGSTTTTTGGTSTTGSTGTGFRFTLQPKSLQIQTDQYGSIYVSVTGGTIPYKYQWIKDNQVLAFSNFGPGQFCTDAYNCGINADHYSKEGRYQVKVTDAAGQVITSDLATISIVDPAVGCGAGNYVSWHPSSMLPVDPASFSDLFSNARGSFIVHAGNPLISGFMISGSGFDYTNFGFELAGNIPAGNDQELRDFPGFCMMNITNISSVAANPGISALSSTRSYYPGQCDGSPSCGYHMEGKVTMQCSYNKWKLRSNTCGWVADVPVNSGI